MGWPAPHSGESIGSPADRGGGAGRCGRSRFSGSIWARTAAASRAWTRPARVVLRRRMRREGVITLAARPAALRGGDGGLLRRAPPRPRCCAPRGHQVRLMSPEYVRPYVKAQKNDDRDAEAIAEAATRPTMRFVELKSEEQLDMQTLHRVRDRLVGERTALINQLRAILLERGIVVPQGRASSSGTRGDDAGARTACRSAPGCGCWSRTCGRSGASSTGASPPSTTSSPPAPGPIEAARRLATDPRHRRAERDRAGGGDRRRPRPSRADATSPPGSAWCRGR